MAYTLHGTVCHIKHNNMLFMQGGNLYAFRASQNMCETEEKSCIIMFVIKAHILFGTFVKFKTRYSIVLFVLSNTQKNNLLQNIHFYSILFVMILHHSLRKTKRERE